MGCLAIVLSIPIIGGIIAAFTNGQSGWGIIGILALGVLWWVAGWLHSRALVAQGIRGEVGARALGYLPEWRRAIEGNDYRQAAVVSRSMVRQGRTSKNLEGDHTTLGRILTLHIGTLHLAGEHDEKYAAIDEYMTTLEPGQEQQMMAAFTQMFAEGDDLLPYQLLEASRTLFPNAS